MHSILTINPDYELATGLLRQLEQWDYMPLYAATIEQGIELTKSNVVKLIILDFSAIKEASTHLQEIILNYEQGNILLSGAYNDLQQLLLFLRPQVQDIIFKPFNTTWLQHKLNIIFKSYPKSNLGLYQDIDVINKIENKAVCREALNTMGQIVNDWHNNFITTAKLWDELGSNFSQLNIPLTLETALNNIYKSQQQQQTALNNIDKFMQIENESKVDIPLNDFIEQINYILAPLKIKWHNNLSSSKNLSTAYLSLLLKTLVAMIEWALYRVIPTETNFIDHIKKHDYNIESIDHKYCLEVTINFQQTDNPTQQYSNQLPHKTIYIISYFIFKNFFRGWITIDGNIYNFNFNTSPQSDSTTYPAFPRQLSFFLPVL